MRVGVFLDNYVPEDGGGYTFQSEVFHALAHLAEESQHEYVVITRQHKHIAALLEDGGLEWLEYRFPGILEQAIAFMARNWPNLHKAMRWRSSLEKRLRRAGIDFIWFLGPRPQEIDLPYMTIVFDLQHRLQPWFPEVSCFGEWEIREKSFARFLRRAAVVIAGTEAGQQEIVDFYQVPAERIHILPHPTPAAVLQAADHPRPELLKRFNLPARYLLYPAQFWPHKNHVNLLLALKKLKNEGLSLPLVLVGSNFGNLRFVERQIDELELHDQVYLLGFVETDELLELYRNALALTYLSFFGPENLPPLEAFALGCPVVASRVSGAGEQLGDAALLADPMDVDGIASAIRRVHADDKLREQLIARGRKRAAAWDTQDFVRNAFRILDGFEAIRRVWHD